MLMVVARPVPWTLDPNRPRKTGSRYNDTLSCIGKPKRSVTMSQKIAVSFHCLLGDFRQKPHWRVILSAPVTGIRVNWRNNLNTTACGRRVCWLNVIKLEYL